MLCKFYFLYLIILTALIHTFSYYKIILNRKKTEKRVFGPYLLFSFDDNALYIALYNNSQKRVENTILSVLSDCKVYTKKRQ